MKTEKNKKSKPKNQKQDSKNKEVSKKVKIDKEIKEKAFIFYAKGLTCKEIAKLLDLSFRTVQNWQTDGKWNEKLNPESIKEKCYELKKKGMSYKEISKTLKISVSTVLRYVKKVKAYLVNKN